MSLNDVQELCKKQKELVQESTRENYQAKIELMSFIETVSAKQSGDVKIKGIRKAKQSAKRKLHKDLAGEIDG